MTYVLDPTRTADNDGFDLIRRLAHISKTNAEINGDPLFTSAELEIADRLGASVAADPTNTHRARIKLALAYFTTAYLIEGGGETSINHSGSSTTSGTVDSETIGPVTVRYANTTTTTTSNIQNVEISELEVRDRIKFLLEKGEEQLDFIDPQGMSIVSEDVAVETTQSRVMWE